MKCEPGFAEAGPDPFGEYLGSGSRNPVRVRWKTLFQPRRILTSMQTQEFANNNGEVCARLSTTLFSHTSY